MTSRFPIVLAISLAACGGSDDDGGPTDTTPPELLSITPADSTSGVWLHERFVLAFSEPVDAASVAAGVRFIDAGGQSLPFGLGSGDGDVLVVAVRPEATAVGALRVEVDTSVTDLHGNQLVAGTTASYSLEPWARTSLITGMNAQAPALDAGGATLAIAASVMTDAGRRIVVSSAAGEAMGAPLGTGSAITPTLGGDLVAWVDETAGVVEVAAWDGQGWAPSPSPGIGSLPTLVAGDELIAWVDADGNIAVSQWVGTVWQPVAGSPIAANGVVVAPALTEAADGAPIVAFIDRDGSADRIRVVTLGASSAPVEEPPIVLTAPPPTGEVNTISVAASGGTIAIAWDEYSGFGFSAHAAVAAAPGWNILPMLDVDPPADARAPAIAIDGAGAPVVAWTEQIEGAHRGYVARWRDGAWQQVGGHSFVASPDRRPGRPAFGLVEAYVPVVAWLDGDGIAIARFNGPGVAPFGLDSRAPIAGCALDLVTPPATLSATGCFTIANGVAAPHAGLVPYDLRSELWSDGALKRRWLALAPGDALTALANGSLDAPAGSMVIKEFALGDPADPAVRRVMETRFLVRTAGGWEGRTYQWRFDGSDADLLPDQTFLVDWPRPGGGMHTHVYPDRSLCLRCHNASVGPLLGLRRDQLARGFDYGGVLDDQLRTLAHVGVVGAGAATTPLLAPHDPRLTVEERVRGYLAANCSHCHNPAGERSSQDFRIQTPLAQTGLCALLVPGDPGASRVYQRVSTRPGMPPIATLQTDPLIVDLVYDWISGMTTCP